MVLQIVFHREVSNLPGGLGYFANSKSIPQSQTTTFHPILIVAILLKYLLLLVERLFQQCHSFRINEVLKFDDSMKDIHMLSQIPSSCRHIQLSVCETVPRILPNFSPSHVKTSFHTDKIESIE